MKLEKIHATFLECDSAATDTRKITPNCMFFCLKGPNFDANTFAKSALEKGAKYVVIDNLEFEIEGKTILVADVLKTLQNLASYHRKYLNLPIIALTGSNGKTTTKELIQAVLTKKYKVKATIGNLNNHIGVPLTLLSFLSSTEIGIVEMGANHQKEIEFLCTIAKPNFGYITNFGKAHLEGFGGFEGVIIGKSEMYAYLRESEQKVFVNLDDAIQVQNSSYINTISFSKQFENADVFITSVTANPLVELEYNGNTIRTNLIGGYNGTNGMAAIAIGNYFSVPDTDIKNALEEFIPDNNRSQLLKINSNEIILDAYNANPSSMKLAIENFNNLEGTNKVAILGDMFELGEESVTEHEAIVVQVQHSNLEKVYFVGQNFYNASVQSDKIAFFETFETLQKFLITTKLENKKLLIKGSRGIALERSLEFL